MRAWLRERWRSGDPRLRSHALNERWVFDDETGAALLAEFHAGLHSASLPADIAPATDEVIAALPSRDWFWEGNVQKAIVIHLQTEGWEIVRQADAATKERGIDVVATRAGRTLAVEVKGFPSKQYADPTRAHERKRASPTSQARHWFAQALFTAAVLRGQQQFDDVALAFPDFPRMRNLAAQTSWALQQLNVPIYFISEDGSVTLD